MGCVQGGAPAGDREAQDHSHEVERGLKKAKEKDNKVKKLLFLGAGGSGKSTLFKQLKVISTNDDLSKANLSLEERTVFKNIVHSNIVEGLAKIGQALLEEGGLSDLAQADAEAMADVEGTELVDGKMMALAQRAWKTDDVQTVFKNRGKYNIQDCVQYFMKDDVISRVVQSDYVPTKDDVLNARSRTTGIAETSFTWPPKGSKGDRRNYHEFLAVDVGGQRNERRKWIHCFQDVTAVIYVCALSAYDQTLFEDEDENRMCESLNLFGDILKLKTFKDTDIIVFFNKHDLFQQKIGSGIEITSAFPEYSGKHNESECYNFIKKKFKSRKADKKDVRQIFMHKTTATDTRLVKTLFNDVQHMIVNRSLMKAGLVAY